MIRERIPDVRFFVVGSDPSKELLKLDSHDVKVTGYVKDVMPFFNSCRVFVSPLRYGAGMKGKIGQSMGYGLQIHFGLAAACHAVDKEDAKMIAAAQRFQRLLLILV